MSSRSLALLVLLMAAPGWAHVLYPPPRITSDDVLIVNPALTLEFPSGVFSVVDVGGGVAEIGASNFVTLHGAVSGDAIGEVVAYDGGTTDQTCGGGNEGQFRVLDDGTMQFCSGSTSSTVYEPLIATGITGGQIAYGGTSATDTLTLNSSTSASARGAVNMCGGNPSVGDNSVVCLSPFSGGLTVGATTATGNYSAMTMSSTVTQDVNSDTIFGNAGGFLFRDLHTHKVSNSALNATKMGINWSFVSQPTIENATDDDLSTQSVVGTWPGVAGLVFGPTYVKSSTGLLTIENEYAVYAAPANIPSGVTVTRGIGLGYVGPAAVSGTLTHSYGARVSLPTGTNRHPYSAVEGALAGATESGNGDWGVEAGAPNRFWYRNESGHIWRTGYLTMTGHITGMATTAGTNYGVANGSATDAGTAAAVDNPVPGAIKAYGMSCALSAAAGSGSDAHTFTLQDDGADTALSCTITTTGTNCQDREEAGVTIAVPSMLSWEITSVDTPSANEATCILVYNLDVW